MKFWLRVICLVLMPLAAWAEDRPRAGILWNRSGLPATFPLQVKTLPGKDYVVFLVDPDTDDPAMAGYIRGGTFFRLLVPPGNYLLRFAYGTDWRGQDDLFGADTGWTQIDKPLDFRVIGTSRRSGYLVTLIEENGRMKIVETAPQDWCQSIRRSSQIREFPKDLPGTTDRDAPKLRYLDQQVQIYDRLCA